MFPVGPNMMFSLIPVIVTIGFIVVFGIFFMAAIKGLVRWNQNNHAPVLTVVAKVVAKRTNVSHHTHHHGGDVGMHHH